MKRHRPQKAILTLFLVLAAGSVSATDLVIHAGTLIDGISDSSKKDV